MTFIENIKKRAKENIKTIVLPEAEDIRILEATQQVLKEQYANIILVGNKEKIEKKAKENNINIIGAEIVDPNNSEKHDEYVNLLITKFKPDNISYNQEKNVLIYSWKKQSDMRKFKNWLNAEARKKNFIV